MGLDNDNDPRFCGVCGGRTFVRGGQFTAIGGGAFSRYRVCRCCGQTTVTRERPVQDVEQRTPTPT